MEAEEVRTRIGSALRLTLAEAGMSQTDLGEALGYTQKAVSGWVTGAKLMPLLAVLETGTLLAGDPAAILRRARVIGAPSVAEAITEDGALDDVAQEGLRSDYDRRIGETASRRRAALSGGTEGAVAAPQVLRLDGVAADPQLVALFIANMFGNDALPTIAGQLALIAAGGRAPDAERAPDATSDARSPTDGDG